MKLYGIDHVQLAMPIGGEEAARAFFGRLLNLTEIPKPPELAKRGGLWFENDAVKIHLGLDPEFRGALKAHPALLVSDLAALIASLRLAGVKVDDADLATYHRVYVLDPFGNRIELIDG